MSKWWVALAPDGSFMGQVCQDEAPTSEDFDSRDVGLIVEMARHGDPVIELPDPKTGTWVPNEAEVERRAIAAIKAQAERDILTVAPLWQQLNDIRNPTAEGAARFAAIDSIRAKSDADENKVKRKAS